MLGVVVAGGAAVRMGGARKPLLRWRDGRTLLERALAALHAAGAEEVLVSANEPASFPGLRVVPDDPSWLGGGPLSGLCAVLAAAFSGRPDARAIAVAGDMPELSPALLAALAARAAAGDAAAVVPQHGRRLEPLCACYRATALPPLQASLASGERALHRAVRGIAGLLVVDAEELRPFDPALASFRNVNTPADLRG